MSTPQQPYWPGAPAPHPSAPMGPPPASPSAVAPPPPSRALRGWLIGLGALAMLSALAIAGAMLGFVALARKPSETYVFENVGMFVGLNVLAVAAGGALFAALIALVVLLGVAVRRVHARRAFEAATQGAAPGLPLWGAQLLVHGLAFVALAVVGVALFIGANVASNPDGEATWNIMYLSMGVFAIGFVQLVTVVLLIVRIATAKEDGAARRA